MAQMPSQPSPAMGALRQERAGVPMQGQNAATIIKSVLREKMGDAKAAAEAYSNFAKLVQTGMGRFMQSGNTVFLINRMSINGQLLPAYTAEIVVLGKESPSVLPARIAEVTQALKKMGYKQVGSYTENPEEAQAWQQGAGQAGATVFANPQMLNMGGAMAPAYKVEVSL